MTTTSYETSGVWNTSPRLNSGMLEWQPIHWSPTPLPWPSPSFLSTAAVGKRTTHKKTKSQRETRTRLPAACMGIASTQKGMQTQTGQTASFWLNCRDVMLCKLQMWAEKGAPTVSEKKEHCFLPGFLASILLRKRQFVQIKGRLLNFAPHQQFENPTHGPTRASDENKLNS